ncbi:hypothetical protein CEXT_800771 [Caerostris extrusa]|uniref:Ycf15 n=1 Tax=Caerostris extrusa TaxID=172846 RepID=A0AAV4PV95_CAEEX|nr:hypothetical protein CEXT_800771 [Caerostris extrusa]
MFQFILLKYRMVEQFNSESSRRPSITGTHKRHNFGHERRKTPIRHWSHLSKKLSTTVSAAHQNLLILQTYGPDALLRSPRNANPLFSKWLL